jgi:tRNA (guanine9-N1)-methyltransferase
VYLTAESDTVIQTLSSDEVYIIGGLVDHNRIKGHVHEKITGMGFRTARLPIEEYLEMKTRKVLTVNQGPYHIA